MEKLSKIYSVVTVGLKAELIDVEVDVGAGIPSLTIVGLPDKAVEESKERVRLALKNSGFSFPQKKIVVNLAPADLKKEGPSFDLPIAIGVLVASGLIEDEFIKKTIFLGELSLGGEIKAVKGTVQAALLSKDKKLKLVVPLANQKEANLVSKVEVMFPENLKELVTNLKTKSAFVISSGSKISYQADFGDFDFSNITGLSQAKRALEIAAAGSHNILLDGHPGGGKTLLSKSIVSILPPLDEEDMLEVTKIYSVSGLLNEEQPVITQRPFRSPHHTTSAVAIIGGGSIPKPGEVSLAHKGVLFMDEFPEFPRSVLEALRQPLEDKVVTISRAQSTLHFPADFILIAAKNPCPCGYLGDDKQECACLTHQILNYNKKISGPLIDRIDLHITVERVPMKKIREGNLEESSKAVRDRVISSRKIQLDRSVRLIGKRKLNASLSKKELEKIAQIEPEANEILEEASETLNLSMRSFLKVMRISRTIADLEQSESINVSHVSEAIQYRPKKETL